MGRRADDEWLPMSDAEVGQWRDSLLEDADAKKTGDAELDRDFREMLDGCDTQTVAWIMDQLDDD